MAEPARGGISETYYKDKSYVIALSKRQYFVIHVIHVILYVSECKKKKI